MAMTAAMIALLMPWGLEFREDDPFVGCTDAGRWPGVLISYKAGVDPQETGQAILVRTKKTIPERWMERTGRGPS
jgi:hypothetical protein